MKTRLAVILTLTLVGVCFSQAPDSLWSRTYGGGLADDCRAMSLTSDGGYILGGFTSSYSAGMTDFWLVKADAAGNPQWSRHFGGTHYDQCYSVQQTTDGGYAMAGYTRSYGAYSNEDYWLVKTDAGGNSQWNRTFGGNFVDMCNAMVQLPSGEYALAGVTYCFGAGSSDFWLVKTDQNGFAQWNHPYGGTAGDPCFAMQATADGGYILAGSSTSYGAMGDFWLVKTNANGDMLWNRAYGGSASETCYSVTQTSDGGYFLVGDTYSIGAGGWDMWLIKTDANGNPIWQTTFGGAADDHGRAGLEAANGRFVAAGYTRSSGNGGADFWIVEVNESADHLWSRTFGGAGDDCCYAMRQADDGGYVLAGSTQSFGAGGTDFWLVKTGPEVVSTQLSGPLSGTLIPDTYHVGGPIWIAVGSTLTILPPATFVFDGPFSFGIFGALLAEGTASDSIVFTTDPVQNPARWRGLRFSGADASRSRLAYCRIENGYATGDWPADCGGGVFCSETSPMFSHCLLQNNTADWSGGAAYLRTGSPDFTQCLIENNQAQGNGGGLCGESGFGGAITTCIVRGNTAHLSGGGLRFHDSHFPTSPVVSGCRIYDNQAEQQGGGVQAEAADVLMNQCTVYDNLAGTSGGGMGFAEGTTVSCVQCTVHNNLAEEYGGGVYYIGWNGGTFARCVVNNNTSGGGGGVFCRDCWGVNFTNDLLFRNQAATGAGIHCAGWNSLPELTHCTISHNRATFEGGGAFVEPNCAIVLRNSVIAFSQESGGNAVYFSADCNTEFCAVGYCNVYDNEGGLFEGPGTPPGLGQIVGNNVNGDPCDGSMNIFLDPLFADMTTNDFHPTAESPCLGAALAGWADHDLEGNARPNPPSTPPDIGAYEVMGEPIAPQGLTIWVDQSQAVLRWEPTGAPHYRVYGSVSSEVEGTLLAVVDSPSWTDPDLLTRPALFFYYVTASE